MRDLDTTDRITMLCDADKRLISPLLSEAAEWVTIGQLRFEYSYHLLCEEGREFAAALTVAFIPALKQVIEAYDELLEKARREIIYGLFPDQEPTGIFGVSNF